MSWRYVDLDDARDSRLASAGKWWGDLPSYRAENGKTYYDCDPGRIPSRQIDGSRDCRHHSNELDLGLPSWPAHQLAPAQGPAQLAWC